MLLGLLPPLGLLTFGIIITIVSAITIFYEICFSYWKKKHVKCIKPRIPFGNATPFFLGQCNIGELFKIWYLGLKRKGLKHGGAYFCGKPVYMPIENDLIKKILISDFFSFPNRGFYIDENANPLSGHMLSLENYKWKNLRAKLPKAFTAAKMRRNVEIMEKTSQELLRRLDELARTKTSVDAKDIFSRYSIDVVNACALGMQTNTLKNENNSLLTESRPFFDYQWSRLNLSLVILIPRPILTALGFKVLPKGTANYFINLIKHMLNLRKEETIKRNDLVDILMDLMDETKEHPDFSGQGKMNPLTFNEFASQLIVFHEAGYETASTTLSFACYELALNPEIQKKLREEILTVLERHDNQITYDSVNEMEYLDRVVDETLRKHPLLPILPRVSAKEYQVPGTDFTLPKDVFVMISNFGIHYDPEYYPDPEKFDPDRFTPENKAKRPYCSYLPFGEGPRICLGKRFGLWQTKIGLVNTVKKYHITLSKKMKLPFRYDSKGIILKAEGDIWVDLERINY